MDPTFPVEHGLEDRLAVATSLRTLVDVEVEDAERSDFFNLAVCCANEKLARADFNQADDRVAALFHLQVETLVRAKEAQCCRDSLRELLSFRTRLPHVVNDHCKLIAFTDWRRRCRSRPGAKVHA